MNILLTIAYDGTNYCGWQRQVGQISVQEKVEIAGEKLFKQKIVLNAAGRTDSGVHAVGQKANFYVDTKIPVEKIPLTMNQFLPEDIVATAAELVPDDFHARYHAKRKTYEYKILNSRFLVPTLRNYTEHIYWNLDVEKMREASTFFVGTHDFKGFCSSKIAVKTTVRTIYEFEVKKENDIISLKITGNGFLYNMIRIIAGTLIRVGDGRIKTSDIPHIIEKKDRKLAGKTASAGGLTLLAINYGG